MRFYFGISLFLCKFAIQEKVGNSSLVKRQSCISVLIFIAKVVNQILQHFIKAKESSFEYLINLKNFFQY